MSGMSFGKTARMCFSLICVGTLASSPAWGGGPCLNVDVILRDEIALPGEALSSHNPTVIGTRVYVSWYGAGLRVLDIDEVTATLVDVAGFDTFPGVGGFDGAWGVYPFLGDNSILISDTDTGLYILALSGPAGSETVTQVGNWDLDPGTYADVWGDGTVAYVGEFGDNKVHFIDVSNPASPFEITEWVVGAPNGGSSAQDVKVANGLLFISLEGGVDGVEIVDVRDPANPSHLTYITTPGIGAIHNTFYHNGFLYMSDSASPVLAVVDLSTYNPDSPPATITTNKWLLSVGSSFVHDMTVVNNRLYACGWNSGLFVYDVSDVAGSGPVLLGSGPGVSTHAVWATADGRWAIVGEERSGGPIKLYEIVETTPILPTISFPDGPVDAVDQIGGATLTVDISPPCAQPDPTSAKLFVRNSTQGGPFVEIPMTAIGGNLFQADIPGAPCGATVTYYVSVNTLGGDTVLEPPGAPTATFTAEVFTSETTVFADDFQANTGWTVGDLADNATTGIWTRVDPIGTAAQPADDHTLDPGTDCFVTGQGSVGGGLGENDVDGGQTTLTSPTLDLSGGDSLISYWRWYSNTAGSSPNADVFVIDVSADGGGTWTNVETIGPAGPGTSGGWIRHQFRVSDFVAPTANVKMRFIASDLGGGSIIEAALDDFRVFFRECGGNPLCFDGILNQGEDRIDCGGPCPPCDCLTNAFCDDNLFCNGVETCDVFGVCVSAAPPCTPQPCDEINDLCADCVVDADCNDLDICTADVCNSPTCGSVPNIYGDVDFNNTVNLFDLFCVLDGFSGAFTGNCTFERLDIEPCTGNGSLNLFDLFAILDSFSGIDPCCSP